MLPIHKKNLKLRSKCANTPCATFKGSYDLTSHFGMQLGDLSQLAFGMVDLLAAQAEKMPRGEQRDEILAILAKHNEFLEKRAESIATGEHWQDVAYTTTSPRRIPTQDTTVLPPTIFGYSWEQLAKMQGGKITIK